MSRTDEHYRERFKWYLIHFETVEEGSRHMYRLPNDFGASVIEHSGGEHAGQWEVCLLQFDGPHESAKPVVASMTGPPQAVIFFHATPEAVAEQLAFMKSAPSPTGVEVYIPVVLGEESKGDGSARSNPESIDTGLDISGLDVSTAANYVLSVYGEPGGPWLPPGGFYKKLIQAAMHADASSIGRIAKGFPNIGYAVHEYKTRGPAWLIEKARP